MIVLDTSASMNDAPDGSCTGGCGGGSKWSAVVGGIDAVVGADDPFVNWGLEFIGSVDNSCDEGGIQVPMAPRNGSAVKTALAGRTAAAELAIPGNTPTRTAVGAASAYLMGLTSLGASAILLMTDGAPDCASGASAPRASDSAGALQAITGANSGGIPTFVVGIGAIESVTQDLLSRMAVAGGFPRSGSPAYHPVGDAIDVVNTINGVVASFGTCTFAIPPPATSDGLTSREHISVQVDGQSVPQDANDGWWYGDDTHTTLTLHGASCDAFHAGTSRQVSVVFLCLI
jgi:hypothetical protein